MKESLVYKGFITPIPEDGNLWVSAQQIAHIVGIASSTARNHLITLEKLGRITQPKSCRYFPVAKREGKDLVMRSRQVKHYTPRVVMRVAFRSNSSQALDFQEWAIDTLQALQSDGVVYRDQETKHLAMQRAEDRQELLALRGEVAELQTKAEELQGEIDTSLSRMNEGQVPWFGGVLTERVTYLIGNQRGTRPKAPQLADTVVVNNVLTATTDKARVLPAATTDKGRVLGYIARSAECNRKPPSTSDVRTLTGRNAAARMRKEDIQELIDELVKEELVEEVTLNGRRTRRWQIK